MLGISRDEGASWEVQQVTERDGCRVLPWIAAGDEGRIAMAWYDTNQTGNPNNLDDAWWDFVVAISTNALDEDPIYEYVVVDPDAHHGSVRTSGLDGDDGPAPDRDLGDFIGIDIDEFGRAVCVFGRDRDDGPNARQVPLLFARQNEGPFLRGDVGPRAMFTFNTDELRIKVDASLSEDLSGGELVNYTWDFGDNTTAQGLTAQHTYKKEGEYKLTLWVQNEAGLYASANMMVSVTEAEETSNLPFYIGALLILMVVLGVILMKKKQPEDKVPDAVPAAALVKEEKVAAAETGEEQKEGPPEQEMDYEEPLKKEEGAPPPGGG